jgi:hypothetical protein
MATLERVKDILGPCNFFMVGTFQAQDILQQQLYLAAITDWRAGYSHSPASIPEGAVQVGQVTVRHGDPARPLWVRRTVQPSPPQWNTTCPDCGAQDHLEVYVGKFHCHGMYLTGDGFAFADAKGIETQNERVRCTQCNSEWDLDFLHINEEV